MSEDQSLTAPEASPGSELANLEELTLRELKFARAVARGMPPARAALYAGYASSYAEKQSHKLARRLKQYIELFLPTFDPNYVLGGIMEIAEDSSQKATDRIRSLELLGKHLRLWGDEAQTVAPSVTFVYEKIEPPTVDVKAKKAKDKGPSAST